MTLASISSYIKAHERLIVILVVLGLLAVGYSKGIAYLASRDQLAANKAAITLQAQVEENEKEATDAKTTLLQYQQLAQTLIANNQAIMLAQKKLDSSTQKQQAVDKTLAPTDLAARWTTLVHAAPAAVQPSVGGYQVDQTTATATVVQLESIPDLQSAVAASKKLQTNDESQLASQTDVVNSLTNQIGGLNKQIGDQTSACTTQITAMKAQNRKSKFRWFAIGFVSGFVVRELIKP